MNDLIKIEPATPQLGSGQMFDQIAPRYDFVNRDKHANDDHGHGTHVAGTIAQATDNAAGVAGVAFEATLMPV